MLDAHPLANETPDMSEEEFKQLVEDIGQHGLRLPIVTYEGLILDGRHRYRAVQELVEREVLYSMPEPFLVPFEGSQDEAKAYVESMNYHRRHLTPAQKACKAHIWLVEQKVAGEFKRGRPKKAGDPPAFSGDARDVAAVRFGVGDSRTLDFVGEIEEKAPDLFEVMQQGGMSVYEAQRTVKEREKAEKREAKIGALSLAEFPADSPIRVGDARELALELEPNSVDLIFTDPPYDKENVLLYGELSVLAARVLKPGGLCLAYCGHVHLPEALEKLTTCLDYFWIFAVRHTGGHETIWSRKLWNDWTPILAASKPPLDLELRDWIVDLAPGGGQEKEHHDWEKPVGEAAYYIEKLTLPNTLVLDPFCGSGTIPLAAKQTGRRVIGFEIDPEVATVAAGRLL